MGHTISIETLIDVLLVLYDECCNSSLRREKTVSDFIEFGKFLDISQINNLFNLLFNLLIISIKYI